jgi:undecaprenyl-diphosphatase
VRRAGRVRHGSKGRVEHRPPKIVPDAVVPGAVEKSGGPSVTDVETTFLVGLQRATVHPWTLRPARTLSHAGEHAALWLATAAAGAVAAPRARRTDWVRAGAAVFVAHGLSVVVKRVARRVRPVHDDLVSHVAVPSRWSFPSSHATSTATAAVVFAPLLGRWTFLLPVVMAWSRMALGVHYPTDVLTGAAIGTAVGIASERQRKGASAR